MSVDIVSSSSAAPGKYTIPIIVEYQDPIQNIVSQTISIGPVSVADSSAQFSVTLKPLTPAEVGSQAQFELTVENRGSTPASVIIDLSQSSVFTPLGNSRIYMDAVAPGGSETRTIILGIEPSTSAGYYTLPIGIISDDGNTYTQNMGIAVQATQETTVSSSINPSFVSPGSQNVVVTAQIANTGNTPIRSVYVTVPQSKDFELVGATDKFIGTLNVDDFTTFQFTVNVPGRLSPGKYGIPIQIVFKDSTNTQHTVTKNVDITLSGPNDAAAMGNTGAQGSGNSSFTRRSGNSAGALSFLGPLAGFGIPGLIVLIALIAVVGYFGYKKFVGVKKK